MTILIRSILPLFALTAFAPAFADRTCNDHLEFGDPGGGDIFICRTGYAVAYSCEYKAPLWVAYRLDQAAVDPSFNRQAFREDVDGIDDAACRASLEDYRLSGFDRGDMAPHASMDTTLARARDSFLLSNMSPQKPDFNRQGWRLLEEYVRDVVADRDEIHVITGAIYEGLNLTIGRGEVRIPSHFYKVLYDSETQEALAFLMLHEPFDFNADIDGFVVPVDQAESFTGFDFLHLVPDAVEDVIEDRDTAATVRWPVP